MKNEGQIGKSNITKAVSIFLSVVWYLTLGVTVLFVVLYGAVLFFDLEIKYATLPLQVVFDEASPLGSESGTDIPILSFENPRVLAEGKLNQKEDLVIPLVLLLGMIWGLYHLRKFFRSLKQGSPFTRENVKSLRYVGFTTTFGAPLVGTLNFMYALRYFQRIDIPGATIDVDLEIYPFIIALGLVILVIAQVFDEGCRLREESELTV